MAIATYFAKNALAIQHVLKQGSYKQFEQILNEHVVELAFDESVVTSEGGCAVDLAVKLLARFYPRIRINDVTGKHEQLRESLVEQAKSINAKIEVTNGTPTITICVGNSVIQRDNAPVFYFGSKGWDVFLSDKSPVGCGDTNLPFAPGVSACLVVSNVFRFVFAHLLRKPQLDNVVSFSLLENFENITGDVNCNDLGSFTIVGLGAIGNGCLWALHQLRGVAGEGKLVDNENIADSNLQRYVMAVEQDKEKPKAEVAEVLFGDSAINMRGFSERWREFIAKQKHHGNEMVLTCLDTGKERMAVQASLPKYILNGYTDEGILGISRHFDFSDEACINCMYIPKGKRPHLSQIIANDLGVPEKLIRDELYANEPISDDLLKRIAAAHGIDYKLIKHFKGTAISAFYSEFICGGTILEVKKDGKLNSTIEAPLAFQSAMAGILMISELFIFRSGQAGKPKYNRTHYNPLLNYKAGINFNHHPLPKDETKRCICRDEIYKTRYDMKWTARSESPKH